MVVTRFNGLPLGSRCGVVPAHDRQKFIAIATEVTEHMQRIGKAIDGDAIAGIKVFQEFNQMLLRICERMVFKPIWRGLIRQRRRAGYSVEIVEQNNRHAPRLVSLILRQIGEIILRQWLCRLGTVPPI